MDLPIGPDLHISLYRCIFSDILLERLYPQKYYNKDLQNPTCLVCTFFMTFCFNPKMSNNLYAWMVHLKIGLKFPVRPFEIFGKLLPSKENASVFSYYVPRHIAPHIEYN